MNRYGCIGKKLTHSFSKEIHAKLADYEYELIELDETELKDFFEKKDFNAINVTIPYKQSVWQYLDSFSDVANRIGAVNTIINKNGKLYGYNTDYFGMKALIDRLDISLKDKKVLILGTGGTSRTARVLAEDMCASEIIIVSRIKSETTVTYEDAVNIHSDAEIIINTTPSGMYPDCGSQPLDIDFFNNLEGVVDAVYNPLYTNLVLNAKSKGIKATGGLYMLVMQAVVAVEKFLDIEISKTVADKVYESVFLSKENIVLTGMPGSGKSTIGKIIDIEGFSFVDTDDEIAKRCGCSVKELIDKKGEKYFRDLETEVIKDISSKGCQIISTGGGAVLRQENVNYLKQNGKLYFIDANPDRLIPTDNRPLSDTVEKLQKLYADRIGIYNETADVVVCDMSTPAKEAEFILKRRSELIM